VPNRQDFNKGRRGESGARSEGEKNRKEKMEWGTTSKFDVIMGVRNVQSCTRKDRKEKEPERSFNAPRHDRKKWVLNLSRAIVNQKGARGGEKEEHGWGPDEESLA